MDRYILDGQYGKYLEMIGVRVGEALRAAGVPEDLFSHKKPVLDEAAYYRFMEAVGGQITDPQLPIRLVTADNIESFSPPIFAAYCSKNGKTCLERLSRYKRIIAPMKYELRDREGETTLVIAASTDEQVLPQFLTEIEIVFVIHIIRAATKDPITPIRVLMQQPVMDDVFAGFLGCPVEQGEENVVVFRTDDLKKPFISHNDSMWEFFEPELQRRLYEMEQEDTFAAKVRSALTELLPGGAGTVEDVAAKLGVSKRTLQRKLMEENTSFRKQLNGTREILARHYIRNTDMSSDEIAFLLGYQELNSFLRAFNLWTVMSIREYKQSLQ